MKGLLVLVLFVFMSSCVTQRRCMNRFPPQRDTVIVETVKDSVVYKDTTVFINIPGATRIDSVPIPCPEIASYTPKRVNVETSLARASAWWDPPNIKLELIQKDTTIERRLNNALKEAYYWKSKYEQVTIIPEPVRYIPKIYKQALSICIFIFAVAFAFMGWKVYKFFNR